MKTTTPVEKDRIRRRLFTDLKRNIDNVSGVMSGTCHNLKSGKRKHWGYKPKEFIVAVMVFGRTALRMITILCY